MLQELSGEGIVKSPTAEGWKPVQLVKDVLALLNEANRRGPYPPRILVFSSAWKEYLDGSYAGPYGTEAKTVRNRLGQLYSVLGVEIDPGLTGFAIYVKRGKTNAPF